MNTIKDMTNVVVTWFNKGTEEKKQEFLSTPRDKLVKYHTTLGRDIRNEFKLWDTYWSPEVIDGVDHSPNHPSQISRRVIEEVWDRLNNS